MTLHPPTVSDRISALLERSDDVPARARENLFTEGCAEALLLEAKLLRARRRLRAELTKPTRADEPRSPAVQLVSELDELDAELARLRGLLLQLEPERRSVRRFDRPGD
jgi:hypothetical protein